VLRPPERISRAGFVTAATEVKNFRTRQENPVSKEAGFFLWDVDFPRSTIFTIFNPKSQGMGVTIHYKGKLNSANDIDSFCEEMEDISRSMDWKYSAFDFNEKDREPLKGLIIGPHEKSEPLPFMIDKNGFLRNPFMLEFSKGDDEFTWFNHIKTQFAPIENHIAVIKLLKYLQKKYISNLDVYDEGDYWQTGDEKILKGKIDFLNGAINQLAKVLDSIEFDKDSSPESIADKIEEVLRNMKFRKPK
jgi:hypothetical protein